MKTEIKLIVYGLLLATSISNAADNTKATFNPETGDVNIPAVEVNGRVEFINVKLRLNSVGLFYLVSAESPPPTISPPQTIFPLRDNILVNSQVSGGIFKLSNGSMWEVKGYPGGTNLGSGRKNISIYEGASSLQSPRYGVRSEYFMLVEGNSSTFFVEPIENFTYYLSDQINANSQSLGGIFQLSNGSLWEIKGYPGATSIGSGLINIKIYQGASSLLEPRYGVKSNYFMLIDGNSSTFFVNPI